MKIVQIFEAKTHLSKLVEEVETGAEQEIIIARHGRPVARLVALSEEPAASCRVGVAKGLFLVPPSIDNDNEAIARLFQKTGQE